MKAAVTPLVGRFAAARRRSTPGPASTRNTRDPTTIAVAGPDASGKGRGVPVPSMTMRVVSRSRPGRVCALRAGGIEAWIAVPNNAARTSLFVTGSPSWLVIDGCPHAAGGLRGGLRDHTPRRLPALVRRTQHSGWALVSGSATALRRYALPGNPQCGLQS